MSSLDSSSRWLFQGQPAIVAHRGYASCYPENTIESLRAALEAGARYLEFDVQLSADEVPILIHDDNLRRTSGIDGVVFDMSADELGGVDVCESLRLEGAFSDIRIPRLKEVVTLLKDWPDAVIFAELKLESLLKFRRTQVLDRVLPILSELGPQCVIVSYDAVVLSEVRQRKAHSIGWVIGRWDGKAKEQALLLEPEFLFCNYQKIPLGMNPLWDGPWHWVVYEIDRPDLAFEWRKKGAAMVESMAVGEMLAEKPFLKGV